MLHGVRVGMLKDQFLFRLQRPETRANKRLGSLRITALFLRATLAQGAAGIKSPCTPVAAPVEYRRSPAEAAEQDGWWARTFAARGQRPTGDGGLLCRFACEVTRRQPADADAVRAFHYGTCPTHLSRIQHPVPHLTCHTHLTLPFLLNYCIRMQQPLRVRGPCNQRKYQSFVTTSRESTSRFQD